MLKKITKWETEDGKVFDTQEEAEDYMFEQEKEVMTHTSTEQPAALRLALMQELLSKEPSMGHEIDIRRQFCRDSAAELRRLHAVNLQLTDQLSGAKDRIAELEEGLKKANSQAEHFEREWYLRGDELEAAQDAQKPVFVLGSAPNAVIPSDIDTYFVIAANGAIAAFPSLVPDVLILNGYTLVDASGVGPETRALATRATQTVKQGE